MKTLRTLLLLSGLTAAIALIQGCYYDNEEYLYPVTASCDTTGVTYNGTVAPIMAANCNGCHGSTAPSAGIVTDNLASVKANMARIWGSVNHQGGYQAMPKNMAKLSDCNLAKIGAWKNAGMPDN